MLREYNTSKFNINSSFLLLIIYLIIFVITSFSFFSPRDSIVIYLQKESLQSDNLQIFFPQKDGSYNEENSQRFKFFDNTNNSVKISLPLKSFEHIRVDPSDEVGDIVITKIELRQMFSKKFFTPEDLLTRAKPLQMIDKLEVNKEGLLIHSTGNDPFFELKIDRPSMIFEYIMFGIISIVLSIILFFVFFKKAYLKIPIKYNKYLLWITPLLISLGIVVLFYPGFMSYDTLHALRGARNGVTDSMWPPMVSYVWRAVDLISLNPSAMHFTQVFLLVGSIFYIIFYFTKKISIATLFLLIYLSIPVILGTIAVIWKDVLMASFFFASFLILLLMRKVENKWKFILLSLLVVFLIFLGVCSRHNAIAAAIPIIFYFTFIICSRKFYRPIHLWLGIIILGSILTGSIYFTKTLLDNYSLPIFNKINNSTDVFIRSERVLDVAGASVCVGSNLFSEMVPNLSVNEIHSLYDPRHINLSSGLLSKVGVDSRINEIWLNTALYHPICFFYNKFQLTKYMIGANIGEQFLITSAAIDNNEYGYSLSKSPLRDNVVAYIIKASALPFFRPWFIYLISIAALIYMIRSKLLTGAYLTILLSAFFYLASLVLMGNAADARLPFYTTTVLLMFIFVSVSEFIKRYKLKRAIRGGCK
jgi:hypothetical protein